MYPLMNYILPYSQSSVRFAGLAALSNSYVNPKAAALYALSYEVISLGVELVAERALKDTLNGWLTPIVVTGISISSSIWLVNKIGKYNFGRREVVELGGMSIFTSKALGWAGKTISEMMA